MDSKTFVNGVEGKLRPIAPMIELIIKKQLKEVGCDEGNLTPEKAQEFIERLDKILERFLGPDGSRRAHLMMMKELRQCAPDYFEETRLI